MNPEMIVQAYGLNLLQYHSVAGGDSNRSYHLRCREGNFFLKVNSAAAFPWMFRKEAAGLAALQQLNTACIPEVIGTGVTNGNQYLLLQWLEQGTADESFWEQLGRSLAVQHRHRQPFFGWEEDNYIGRLPQPNGQRDSWAAFYSQERILPLVQQLTESGAFDRSVARSAGRCCQRLDQLFPPEPPALLHGDLWYGNVMPLAAGGPALFDPAVYYGHREMDLGMSRLFGGFHQRFYEAYQEMYPLEPGWHDRLELAQLYPLLVHAVLFGGSYIQDSAAIIRNWGA